MSNCAFYDDEKIAMYYHRLYPRTKEDVLPYIKESNSSSEVLDVACGSGAFAFHWAPQVKSLIGIDISVPLINIAKNEAKKKKTSNASFKIKDMRKFNIDRKFDVIAIPGNSFSILSNEEDQISCLTTLRDHLKTDGTLLVQIVTFQKMFCSEQRFPKTVEDKTSGLSYSIEHDFDLVYEDIVSKCKMTFKTLKDGKIIDETVDNITFALPTMRELRLLLRIAGLKLESYEDFQHSRILKCKKI